MKKFVLPLVAFLGACSTTPAVLDADFHPTNRGWGAPVWQDEFDDAALDAGKWVAAKYCGGYNEEAQCYRPENVAVDGANATITAKVEGCSGTKLPGDEAMISNEVGTVTCPADPAAAEAFAYSSGRIHTLINPTTPAQGWKYGRIEIRAKLPAGMGTWPAFWMLPMVNTYGSWPASGEIDIMETVNLRSPQQAGDFIQSNVHLCVQNQDGHHTKHPEPSADAKKNCTALNSAIKAGGIKRGPIVLTPLEERHVPAYKEMRMNLPPAVAWPAGMPNLVADFHTYAMEWNDLDLRFYVDNQLIGTAVELGDADGHVPFRQGFYLIINLAVGGKWPTSAGPVDPSTWLPGPDKSQMVLDWVRVYACAADPEARKCIASGGGLGEAP